MSVQLRPVSASDRDAILAWRNDPYIVARSTSRRPVGPNEHEKWFASLLADPNVLAFVIELDGRPSGHVRLERRSERCIITVYLVPKETGKGQGVEAIRAGCRAAAERWPGVDVLACVREENREARAGFTKAGFRPIADGCPEGHVALFFVADDDEGATAKRFTRLLELHGENHRSLDWGSRDSQQLRFRLLAGIATLNGRSVLDVGCGLADFSTWLSANQVQVDYTGLELTPALVERARRLHSSLRIVRGNILDSDVLGGERFDYVLASGIFATYANRRVAHLRACVARMWELARNGIAFNSLSAWAAEREPGEFYADPSEVLDMARSFSPWVALRHDYHPRDFTVYMYRQQSR